MEYFCSLALGKTILIRYFDTMLYQLPQFYQILLSVADISLNFRRFMLFCSQKYLGSLIMPLPLLLMNLLFCAYFTVVYSLAKTGKSVLTIVIVLFTLLGMQPVADTLLMPSEKAYQARYELRENSPQDVNYIVVLGGGFTYNPEWAPSANLLNIAYCY